MFQVEADAGPRGNEVDMSRDPQDDHEQGERDPPPRDDDVDEASEDSFPASDPPSYGSPEPGSRHPQTGDEDA
jgi:hypothetical protein